MEEKLKKQRNRLFLRINLILLTVWIVVSAVFCVVRLNIEKANIQSSELSVFSHFNQLLYVGGGGADAFSAALVEDSDLVYDDSGEQKFDSQIVVVDRDANRTIADTAGTVVVLYRLKWSGDGSAAFVSMLDYHRLRDPLSDEEFALIEEKLNTVREDGNYYELDCTKFRYDLVLIPVELKLVLIDGKDPRRIIDDNVATFDLSENVIGTEQIYESGYIGRNTIPKSLILDGETNRDFIGTLTKEQLKEPVGMIPRGGMDYIFYAYDYLNFFNEEDGDDYSWTIRYAKEVNLFDNCKTDLLIGILLIFGFFLTIAVILCIMIWRTVKAQIIQEQKRLDLTNALAHDIKTPLFVISGYAYTLKEDIDENERDLYLDNIIEQTDTVNALVHRMLSFSKLDSYSMTLDRTDFDLYALVKSTADEHAALPGGRTIEMTHSGDNMISADRELTATVIRNLTENAVKYSLPDSRIRIDVSGRRFSIANESEPLTKAELKQIWEPYARKDKSRHQKGSGLGLSIVKSILDLHGFKYDVHMKDDTFVCSIRFES